MVAKLDFADIWLWPPNLTIEFFESPLASFMKLLGNFLNFSDCARSYVLYTYFVSYGQNTEACTGCLASVDGPIWPSFLVNQPFESQNMLNYNFVDNWIRFSYPQELHQLELYRGSYAHFTKPVSKYLFKH